MEGVRPRLKVRFQKPLSTLQLTANCFGIAPNQARHKIGLGHPGLLHQKNPLPFFQLLPIFSTDHPYMDSSSGHYENRTDHVLQDRTVYVLLTVKGYTLD